MAMNTGMGMLIKSFGLDPDEIKKNIEGMGQLVVKMAADQQLILTQNAEILELLKDLKNGKSE